MLRAGAMLGCVIADLLLVYQLAVSLLKTTGDVELYQRYAQAALAAGHQLPHEYPALSTTLFAIPELISPQHYLVVFALLTALAVWATVLVVDRLSRQGWWLLVLVGLGAWGLVFFRYDMFVVLLTTLAYAAAQRRRWTTAQALLALAGALKLYPVILMPLVVMWQWRVEERRRPWPLLVAATAGAIALVLTIGPDPAQAARLMHFHSVRPIEFESLAASLGWLLGPTTYGLSFGSYNLASPTGTAVMGGVSVVGVGALLALYAGFFAGGLDPAASWTMALLVTIGTSKVFSTQYLLWVLPFVALATAELQANGRESVRRAVQQIWVLICLITSVVFPIGMKWFRWDTLMSLLVLRNALWVVAGLSLVWPAWLAERWTTAQTGFWQEIGWWWQHRKWMLVLVAGLAALPLLIVHLMPHQPEPVSITSLDRRDLLDLGGFYDSETDTTGTAYRWTDGYGKIVMSGMGFVRSPVLTVRLGGLPTGVAVPRSVQIQSNAGLRLVLPALIQPRRYQILLPPLSLAGGTLRLDLIGPTFHVATDSRELGVRLDALGIHWPMSSIAWPSPSRLVRGVLIVVLAVALAHAFGLRPRLSVWLGIALLLLVAGLGTVFVYTANAWESRAVAGGLIVLIARMAAAGNGVREDLPGDNNPKAIQQGNRVWLRLP